MRCERSHGRCSRTSSTVRFRLRGSAVLVPPVAYPYQTIPIWSVRFFSIDAATVCKFRRLLDRLAPSVVRLVPIPSLHVPGMKFCTAQQTDLQVFLLDYGRHETLAVVVGFDIVFASIAACSCIAWSRRTIPVERFSSQSVHECSDARWETTINPKIKSKQCGVYNYYLFLID